MDDVFKALADASRRWLLDSLNARNGQTLRELCAGLDMARQSVSKHLAVLEAASLVTTMWHGREKLHYLNAAPINDIAERWINRYEAGRVTILADLKRTLEDTPMSKPEFVYKTYIRTTPERLWQALTDPAFTRRYWDTAFTTDWTPGSPMTWDNHGVILTDPEQVVLEIRPVPQAVLQLAQLHAGAGRAVRLGCGLPYPDEGREKVEGHVRHRAGGEGVKLTIIHDGFDADSVILSMIGDGWPQVVSSLKTLLETGEPLSG